MSNEQTGLAYKIKRESDFIEEKQLEEDKANFLNFPASFSSIIVDGLLDEQVELQNNNNNNNRKATSLSDTVSPSPQVLVEGGGLPSRICKFPNDNNKDELKDGKHDNFYSVFPIEGGNRNASCPSSSFTSISPRNSNFVSSGVLVPSSSGDGNNVTLMKQVERNQDSCLRIQSTSPLNSLFSSSSPFWSSYSSSDNSTLVLTNGSEYYSSCVDAEEGDQQGTTSLESASSTTVSFLTEIEVKPKPIQYNSKNCESEVNTKQNEIDQQGNNCLLVTFKKMEASEEVGSVETIDKETGKVLLQALAGEDTQSKKDDDEGVDQSQSTQTPPVDLTCEKIGAASQGDGEEEEEECDEEDGVGEEGGEGFECEDDEDDDTTTLSSEAVVDDIELILMPEMCQDMHSQNLSPKLVRVTELKFNTDDVFCDDDETDEDQSSRHEFRSIVDEVCDEEEEGASGGQQDPTTGRFSVGDDDVSSGSELISVGRPSRVVGAAAGESSKSSSSSGGRRRRSTSGRINSGVQTDITAVEEPAPLSFGPCGGFRKKSSGKSSRLGIPGGVSSTNGKKLNWKSELTLLPSKMKVKQSGFNSFESNDERDQYSPRVAKFTSQDTLNLSSQFLKPSTLYRTRNLSRNLNQFASSESTFMLPMSSEQQLSSCDVGESPRGFRDRMSSTTSNAGVGTAGGGGGSGNFKGAATSYSAYQISSILSGSNSGFNGGGGGGIGMGTPLGSARLGRHSHHQHLPHQQLVSAYSGVGAGHMMMMTSRHFRSSMPDLNAVNKSYAAVAAATMADSHRRRQPSASSSKPMKHSSTSSRHRHSHLHSSTSFGGGGFRLQKRSSSDEETSSLIDESERCLRSSIDLLLTDELPSPGGVAGIAADSSCFRSSGFGGSSAANIGVPGGFCYYSNRRSCSQPILNDQAYPPDMKDPSMGSPFLPRKLSDMRCSRWAKVILPNGHVAVVSVKETDEIQDSLTIHTDTGCVINLPFRKVVFAWRSSKR